MGASYSKIRPRAHSINTDSLYVFHSADLHLGEISLECSRAGAAAVALWATQRFLPLTADGDFARDMALCRDAACDLHARLSLDDRFLTIIQPELDIVLWAPNASKASAISALSQKLFDNAAGENLHLALVELPEKFTRSKLARGQIRHDNYHLPTRLPYETGACRMDG